MFWNNKACAAGMVLIALIYPAEAGVVTGNATEWTQILNNAQLVTLSGQSVEQIQNQVVQIGQLGEQIQNQLRIYENMLQNSMVLPDQVWGAAEADLKALQRLVQQGQGIAFSMGNLDDVLSQRFQSYSDFSRDLPAGEAFSDLYSAWSTTNRDTIAATLNAAGLTSEHFTSEEQTMARLRAMSDTAAGQMQALQVGHSIASQHVAQTQKLRGLVSQQVTLMATWYQSEQAARDLAQARREQFFNATLPPLHGGQIMEPRW